MHFYLPPHTILLTVAGSCAYNLDTTTSDLDIKGVAIPPEEVHLSYLKNFEQADKPAHIHDLVAELEVEWGSRLGARYANGLEGTVYELRKFVKLAADCNPNILDVLFCRPEDILHATPLGRALWEHAPLFLSKKAYYTFTGYAMSQLKRIRGHRAWLLSPPAAPPTRGEFDLPERSVVPADQRGAAEALIRRQLDTWDVDLEAFNPSERKAVFQQLENSLVDMQLASQDAKRAAAANVVGIDADFLALLDREKAYRAAQQNWKQYQNWKKSRNPARAALEAKHGYDTKHAMHLVRLMRMGAEILRDGVCHVWRDDAEELLSIRNGHWSYDELVGCAETQEREMRALYEGDTSPLPKAPPRDKIDALCIELQRAFYNNTEFTWRVW